MKINDIITHETNAAEPQLSPSGEKAISTRERLENLFQRELIIATIGDTVVAMLDEDVGADMRSTETRVCNSILRVSGIHESPTSYIRDHQIGRLIINAILARGVDFADIQVTENAFIGNSVGTVWWTESETVSLARGKYPIDKWTPEFRPGEGQSLIRIMEEFVEVEDI